MPTSKGPPSSPVQLRIAVWTGDTRDTRPEAVINASGQRPLLECSKGTLRPRCRASPAAVIPSDDLDVADGRSCANGSVKASVDSPPENSAPPPIPCLRVRNLLMAHSAVDPAPEAFQPFWQLLTVMGTRRVMRNKRSETEAAHEKSVSEEVRTAPQNDHLGYARLLGQIDLFVGLDRVTLAKLAAHLEP